MNGDLEPGRSTGMRHEVSTNPPDPSFDRGASRRDALARWQTALSHGDVVEVDRIVQQSHRSSATQTASGLIGEGSSRTESSNLPTSHSDSRSPR